ncbi:hypothetical protein HDU99_000818, partial [Rhizoclosmatium hyalinum]
INDEEGEVVNTSPATFLGCLWLPHKRTMQDRFSKATEGLKYIGYDENIAALVIAKAKSVEAQVNSKGRALGFILGSDKKDIGIVTVATEVIKGRKRIRGTQDLGGNEERFNSWVIDGYIRTVKDLENIVNDFWEAGKRLHLFLEKPLTPKAFAFDRDIHLYLLTILNRLQKCFEICGAMIPARLEASIAARDKRDQDNTDNNKNQFRARLELQRTESLVKEYSKYNDTLPGVSTEIKDLIIILTDSNHNLTSEFENAGLIKEHELITIYRVRIVECLEVAIPLNEGLHTLLAKQAHKLAVYSVTDTQRILNEPIATYYVDSVTEGQSRLIENHLMEKLKEHNMNIVLGGYDGASHALVRRAGVDGAEPTLLTSLAASLLEKVDERFKGRGKTARMKAALLQNAVLLITNASNIHFGTHRASKWLKAPPIATVVEQMTNSEFLELMQSVVAISQQWLTPGSWAQFKEAVYDNQLDFDEESCLFGERVSLILDTLELVDINGRRIWVSFFFSFLCTIARHNDVKVEEAREWLVRAYFLQEVSVNTFWLDHFYKPIQKGETNLWKFIDPPHWMKRLSTQLSGAASGFKDFSDHKLLLNIAESKETKLIPMFFTNLRDKQNVADAFTLFGADVEEKARSAGNHKMAELIRIFRRMYEACDYSGLSIEHRDARFDEMWEWLEEHYFPEIFACIPTKRVPARPNGDKDLDEPSFFQWENKTLPSELLEALAAFIDVRNQVKDYLQSSNINNPQSTLPILVERALGTNNLETEMSILRIFEVILSCGRVSQIDPIKAHITVKKYRHAQLLRLQVGSISPGYTEAPSRGRSYREYDEGRWEAELGDADTVNSNRHSKDTSADKMGNADHLALRDSTIRAKHKTTVAAAILVSSESGSKKRSQNLSQNKDIQEKSFFRAKK